MKVATAFDEAHAGLEGLLVDELRERYVAELELAGDAHHVPVEPFFGERAESPQPQLASEDDVERVRWGAARLVPELDAGQLLYAARALLVPLRRHLGHQLADVDAPERDVPMVVALDVLQVSLGEHLREPFREHDGAVELAPALAGQDEIDDEIGESVHREPDFRSRLARQRIRHDLVHRQISDDVLHPDDE